MAAINVDKMSLQELLALQPRLEKAIAEARQRESSEIKEKISELAAGSGFSLSRPALSSLKTPYPRPPRPSLLARRSTLSWLNLFES